MQAEESDPQEVIEQVSVDEVVESMQEIAEEAHDVGEVEQNEEKMVPLSTLQKMRKRAQEAELKAQWLEQQQARYQTPQAPPEPVDDSAKYESATREDLVRTQQEMMRAVEEKLWIKNNSEKFDYVKEHLPTFLKQRPNLASAIQDSENRYEEAYTLMEALTRKQQTQLRKDSTTTKPAAKAAPNAPGGVPKAAALNEAVDVMTMSDKEFSEWRQAQKRRR